MRCMQYNCFIYMLLMEVGWIMNYLTLKLRKLINNELISISCYKLMNYEHLISNFNSLISIKNIGIQRILI